MLQYEICQEKKLILTSLTPLSPADKKGHTHSNKSLAKADKLSECV